MLFSALLHGSVLTGPCGTAALQVNPQPDATAAVHSGAGVGGGQGVAGTEDFEQAYQRALKYALSAAAQDAQR